MKKKKKKGKKDILIFDNFHCYILWIRVLIMTETDHF